MENQPSKEKKLSLIVVSILNVVNECAIRSCEDISKDEEVYSIIKAALKDESITFLHYWACIFYLYDAIHGIEKKLYDAGFSEEEFTVELMKHVQELLKITSLYDFNEIENYEGGITKFMGHKLCQKLNIEDASFDLKINTTFMGYLLHGFYPALDNAWSINERLAKRKAGQDAQAGIEKLCPRCGHKNPSNAFRCRNEDCLDILPENN